MQVFRCFNGISAVSRKGGNTISDRFACLQFDAVVHDTVFAPAIADLERNEVDAISQSCIGEVGSIDDVATAVQGTAIDTGILIAGLPGCS